MFSKAYVNQSHTNVPRCFLYLLRPRPKCRLHCPAFTKTSIKPHHPHRLLPHSMSCPLLPKAHLLAARTHIPHRRTPPSQHRGQKRYLQALRTAAPANPTSSSLAMKLSINFPLNSPLTQSASRSTHTMNHHAHLNPLLTP